jgi:FAD:protein FMN transferase
MSFERDRGVGSSELPALPAVRRMRIHMGCTVVVEACADSSAAALAASEAAFAAVAKAEGGLHPGRPESDLAVLNAAAAGSAVSVRADTWQLLRLAQDLSQLTAGVFDPCLPAARGRISDLELESDGRVIVHVPVAVDLGGMGKGHAVDRAVTALLAAGCTAGLVNAGGDMRVFGPLAHEVMLRGPGGRLDPLRLRNASIAVSDADATAPPEHRGYYVRAGVYALAARYAAVVAKEAVLADALTKCVLLCRRERANAVLAHFGATLAASD